MNLTINKPMKDKKIKAIAHKVLILPGGGIRGIIPAAFLSNFRPDSKIHDMVHTIGGTSVGAILGCMYASGNTFRQTYDLMRDGIPRIFKKKWYDPYGIFGPVHDKVEIEKLLQNNIHGLFGKLNPNIFVTSVDFANGKIKVFDNVTNWDDIGMEAWKVARCSSAAPTYFAPFDCERYGYIDGGLYENIPIMSTCVGLKSKCKVEYEIMDIFIIGTGHKHDTIKNLPSLAKWGIKSWAKPLVDSLTNSNELGSMFIAEQMPFHRLNYFNPVEVEDVKLNDVEAVPRLCEQVEKCQNDFNREFGAWITKIT